MYYLFSITRSLVQGSACEDLGCNGQSPAIRLRPLMFWFTPITRSPAQKPACRDLGRNGQRPAIVPEATYVLVYAHNAFASPEACV
ncbi:hypothetical protein EFO53_12300 [Lacticaseibacillus rhamnosus]|uniref:Malolactic regulator n=1 Tax=Lacticaseibacillus rhamnosus TaxID=47715 RepID=A0AB74I9G3_LACRH|nr:hypothetical protein [Lacticaseibacillus rhamnosus]CAR91376.1 Conserved protein [Lacticaseibacillus rhamnosus Lc 705]MCT3149288.1 hypothetical protein [Lacticaseibacillus rhamnosus]MCT3157258.1 hypothetical protein [Lacticaseibacillus rhamnosus]MCT3159261.1 hypothetical protein [Lacticaseibacillus rhamnosus]